MTILAPAKGGCVMDPRPAMVAEEEPCLFQIISPGVDYNELQTRSSDVSKSAVDRAIFNTRKITVGEMFLHTLNKATVAHHQ
jgi:hypothetical protein